MSARTQVESWLPERAWWGILACGLVAGLVGNWFVAAGVVLLLIIHVARPFDFVAAFLLVTAGSIFTNYQSGTLTLQMSILSAAILLMLFCYFLSMREEFFSLSPTDLAWPLGAFLLLSIANSARGLLVGHPTKAVLLETFPVFAIGSAFLVANVFEPRRDLRLVVVALLGIAFGSAAFGYHTFSITRTHMSGVYFSPTPGIVALFLVNLALRSGRLATSLAWLALSLPLFLHQFLSFGRGLWISTLAGLVASILIFAIGRDSRPRWARSGLIVGTLLGTCITGALALAVLYGQTDILLQAGTRFASISDPEPKLETAANMARLMEYAAVVRHIWASPWFGHGLGYTFFVTIPIIGQTRPQWWVHENYLLVWLKQGLLGLVLFLWMLWTGFWWSARHARRREDQWESSWLAATATGTLFLTVYSLTDFPFDNVQSMFLLALLWGVSMAISCEGFLRFRWVARDPAAERSRQETV